MSSSSPSSDPLFGLNPEHLLEIAADSAGDADTMLSARNDLPTLEEVALAFPDLEVEELIGRGGMSAVFRARQPRLNRVVALKVLPKSLAAIPGFAERFTREGQVLARLSHPHIVTVHDFGERGGFWFLIMEHVDGVNLRQAMRAGRFTPEQALQVIPAICDALQFAHGQGVLHRDIKPENILLDVKGGIKIADFGIAKILGEDVEGAMLLTQSGAKLGTAPYMAPEQIEKPASVDHRADIYSLGVVFYEMLTGELPLGRFAAPSELAGVGGCMDAVVFRALEKERARRQQSAEEFKTQVAGAGTGTVQGRPKAPRRLQSFWMIPAGVFLCALMWWLVERWTLTGSASLAKSAAAGGGGLPPMAIASATMLMGMLLFGLAVPLWLRGVPRNSFYGVRLPSTVNSDKRWFEVNAVFGKQLFWWSLAVIGAGIAGFYQLPRHQDAYPWAAITLTVVAVAAAVAATLWWMHQHPIDAPAKKKSRLVSWGGQAVVAVVIAMFIKSFIAATYRVPSDTEPGVAKNSHWFASHLDSGFSTGNLVIFQHESGHYWIARVVAREEEGLLLKRGGSPDEFFVPWDKIVGKMLFSHFTPDAVKAAGVVEDRTPTREPPIEGTAKALTRKPELRFVRMRRKNESWQQAFTPAGQVFSEKEDPEFPWSGIGSEDGNPEHQEVVWLQIAFEHPDFDPLCDLAITVMNPKREPVPFDACSVGIHHSISTYSVNASFRHGGKLPEIADMVLRYSIGRWQELMKLDPGTRSPEVFANGCVITSMGDNSEHQAFVTWSLKGPASHLYDAVAVLKNGQRIRSSGKDRVMLPPKEGSVFETLSFPLPLREIRVFEIRSRPILTEVYEDVVIPLLP
jgi:hypothetical protein